MVGSTRARLEELRRKKTRRRRRMKKEKRDL